jgi:putative flavoprotein involved in K+ transport
MRGVVDSAPGLFFCGLSFQYAFSSMVLPGVGRDADHVAGRIAERARGRRTPARPAKVA